MNYSDLKKSFSVFKPALVLEGLISHATRRFLKRIFFWISLILLVLASGVFFTPSAGLNGLFFLVLVFWLLLFKVEAFHYSYASWVPKKEPHLFDLAVSLAKTSDKDILGGFLRSSSGKIILQRCGISGREVKELLSKRTQILSAKEFSLSEKDGLVRSFLSSLFSQDKSFEHLLISRGVSKEAFVSCGDWAFRLEHRLRQNEKWWSKESLEMIPSLGRDWAYGKAYSLMRASTPLRFSPYQHEELHSEILSNVVTALSRSADANVLLLGDEGVGKMEVVEGLARLVLRREVPDSLKDRHFFVLDEEAISSSVQSAQEFETLVLNMFAEAASSGNVIIVIPDLFRFVETAKSFGAGLGSLLGRFLTSPALHIIAVCDTEAYHRNVEGERDLTKHFDLVQVSESGILPVLRFFEDSLLGFEKKEGVVFTYPALFEAVSGGEKYAPEKTLYETVADVLSDTSSRVREEGRSLILRDDVLKVLREKAGSIEGELEDHERARLENLENLLHERVVGQDEAITAVSDALRRARSGINNPNRPVGSFLFLGPTGVGKTETTKALSEIFFGANAPLLRLDMSEYSTPESVNRLIGAFDSPTPGILSSLVRDHRSGVLLLDEFEKTDSQVLDLFLQILDEGMFSDSLGRKINARNLIIVATSNAGSDYIFEIMKGGGNLLEKRDEVIEKIIKDNIFRPELLNRFDGIILFHPLEDKHLREVGKLLLARLAWRLKEKGMNLVVNDALLDFLVEHGKDPKFGARPLNRVIQDKVEKIIADGIIAGKYKAGDKIELSSQDLA